MLADFGLTAVIDESAAGSVIDGEIKGTRRWMAPELMHPEKFGFTKECQIRLPSRGTDIYALGMTILEVRSSPPPSRFRSSNNCGLFEQVITGCHPFNSIIAEPAVMYNVLGGCRPDRPQSCFTDQLWELLMETWLVEHGSQPRKRPKTSTIRDRLNEEVNNWGTLIVPPPVVENTVDDSRYFLHDSTDHSSADLRTKRLTTIQRSLWLIRPLPTALRPTQTSEKRMV